GFLEGDGAAEADAGAVADDVVEAGEGDVEGVVIEAGGVEDVAEVDAGPEGVADGLDVPGDLAGDGGEGIELTAAVAGALEGGLDADGGEAGLEVSEGEGEGGVHEAADGEA